ncbi:recombinase family protein [Microbacterium esteraromaticum]|uniref:recombinase family protein n=1 Tax=Microbacterium esteraromaticum TaxID=57043 RepID=UPI002368A5F9|nr:recombinase family protein [Microbacterium esteraromaticum]WDH78257.1 recombinase family protein [Microbacterium esteraromaticum]
MTAGKPPTRAVLYARQSVSDPEGIEIQLEKGRALALSRGFEIVGEYIDDGVSGYRARDEKTDFTRLLQDARERRFEVVIVRKLDRLGRSLSALEALTTAKAQLVTTDGEVDLTTVSGRLVANVLTSVARAESETKAERRVNRNDDRRRDGIPTSGRVPYGYRWITTKERAERGTDEAYELDDERAADVRGIFEAFLGGVPLGSIARDLNVAGKRTVPTKRHPDGVPFSPTSVRRMLMNPYYAALLPREAPKDGQHYNQSQITADDCVPGRWPAIVKPEQWSAAKAKLAHPDRKTSPGPTRRWLLSGLAICGGHGKRDDAAITERALATTGRPAAADLTRQEIAEAAGALAEERCGQPIRTGGGEKGIHSYRCGSMAHFMRRGAPLDEFIERLVIARLTAPDAAGLLIDRERPDVDTLSAELTRLEAVRRELGDDRDEGLIGRVEYQRRLKRVDEKLSATRGELEAGSLVEPLRGLVGAPDVHGVWGQLPLGHKRAVIEALMTIVVYSVGQGNRRNMTDEAMANTLSIVWRRSDGSAAPSTDPARQPAPTDELSRQRERNRQRDGLLSTPNCPECLHRMEPAGIAGEAPGWRCVECGRVVRV